MSWMQKGYGKPLVEPRGVMRFWMKPGDNKNVVFLDDEPSRLVEHNLRISGQWGNFFTCLCMVEKPCPLCEAGDPAYEVGAYTIVDCTQFTNKQGKTVKDVKKLLMAKTKVLNILEWQKGQQPFANHEFNVFRSDGSAPNTGDNWRLIGAVDVQARFPDKDLTLFNYEESLAPKTPQELEKVVARLGFKPNYDEQQQPNF